MCIRDRYRAFVHDDKANVHEQPIVEGQVAGSVSYVGGQNAVRGALVHDHAGNIGNDLPVYHHQIQPVEGLQLLGRDVYKRQDL